MDTITKGSSVQFVGAFTELITFGVPVDIATLILDSPLGTVVEIMRNGIIVEFAAGVWYVNRNSIIIGNTCV